MVASAGRHRLVCVGEPRAGCGRKRAVVLSKSSLGKYRLKGINFHYAESCTATPLQTVGPKRF